MTQFSVLLPVYAGDQAPFLARAFASATVDQELQPDEVVIVQDGPVGAEVAAELRAISEDPRVRLVRLERNVGLARALEEGLARCSHEIVARVDADDVSLPARFATQVPLVAGGLDLVGSALREFEADEAHPGALRVLPTQQAEIARYARFADPFNHPTVVYRREAVRRAGGYEDLPLMEDYLLFARMIGTGARVANVAEPLVLYRTGAGAYARRGGRTLLASELELQRRLRADGFTTRAQHLRNVVVRGGYRLVPVGLRRWAYRTLLLGRQQQRARSAA